MTTIGLCARCGSPLTPDGERACSCRTVRTREPNSNLHHVITIAAALAQDRVRRGEGSHAVTDAEMAEASAITRSPVQA